jgi:hypothetical protein
MYISENYSTLKMKAINASEILFISTILLGATFHKTRILKFTTLITSDLVYWPCMICSLFVRLLQASRHEGMSGEWRRSSIRKDDPGVHWNITGRALAPYIGLQLDVLKPE